MIINGIKLSIEHTDKDFLDALKQKCGFEPHKYRILKKSVDARFNNVSFVYNIEVCKKGEKLTEQPRIEVPKVNTSKRPVVVGSGPCGLFAAYILALSGACPVLIERGKCVEDRIKDVNNFWNNQKFNASSNVQFGEGGAGTFSDGKLTTQISNPLCREVLHTFVECGADEEILYLSKPHLGTDNLVNIVKNIRNKIIELGGDVLFEHKLTDIYITDNKITGIKAGEYIDTDRVILALGHSARDTFEMLYNKGINMQPKAFSVGVRIEHLQKDVNMCQYGKFAQSNILGAADYKLSYHTKSGRGVYTFCMCPGGVVVGAASQDNTIVTNGMSYHARNGINANSAFLVSVTPEDFGYGALDGMYFQQKIEQSAYELAGETYKAPCQLLGDYINNRVSVEFGNVKPTYLPGVSFVNIRNLFPQYIVDSMLEAIPEFTKKLKCFGNYDAVITGPETRSSSPVRIVRDDNYMSNIKGIFPAGEGAGYAGGIMSAAVDGIKCAFAVIEDIIKTSEQH